ncbi:MAG: discoidin domain-containing protein [Smithella sp.]
MSELFTATGGLLLESDASPTTSTLNTAAGAIDGNEETEVGNYLDSNDSLGCDLGVAKTIQKCRLYLKGYSTPTSYYNTNSDSFCIYTSDNGSAWTLRQTFDAPTINVTTAPYFYVELILDTAVDARYVKIRTDSAGIATQPGAANSYFTEIKVYGVEAQAATANYLVSPHRDRIALKGLSLGKMVAADGKTSFLIPRHDRLRTLGISLEDALTASDLLPPMNVSASMLFWWDMAYSDGLTFNGSYVSAVADRGSLGNDLTGNATYQPLYYDDGRPVSTLKFDGTDDVMNFDSAVSNIQTLCYVMRYEATAGYQQWIGHSSYYDFWGGSDATKLYANDANNPLSLRNATHYVNSDTGGITTANLTKSTSWRSVITVATSANLRADKILSQYGGSLQFVLHLAEIVAYSGSLTASEIAALTAYFVNKWGIT